MTQTPPKKRHIRLRDLETLAAVVQSGSMRKAADVVHLSQPAISRAIRDLEDALNVKLLQRGPNGVETTAFGDSVLRRSRAVFDEIDNCIREIAHIADPGSGEVRLGCMETLHAGLVGATVAATLERHPRIRFVLETGQAADLVNVFLHGRLVDFVVARPAVALPVDMNGEPLLHDSLLVVTSKQHPFARKRKLALADLAEERWILSRNEISRESPVVAAFAEAEFELPRRLVISGSLSSRYTLIEKGRFVTVVPHSLLPFGDHRRRLAILPVKLPTWTTPTMIITLKGRTLSPAADLFLDELRACARRHGLR